MSEPFMDEPTSPVAAFPPAAPPARRAFFLHRYRWFLLIGAVFGVVAALGGVAWAVGRTSASSPPTAAGTASASAPASAAHHGGRGVRGTIMSESGSTWTLRLKAGKTVTVQINPQTQFGTRKAPAAASAFPVGATVVVTGTLTNATVSAIRITAPAVPSATPAGSPSPAPAAT